MRLPTAPHVPISSLERLQPVLSPKTATLLLAFGLASCAEAPPFEYTPASDSADTIGVGVTYTPLASDRNDRVLIVYGGFGARDQHSLSWAEELMDAHFAETGVAHLFSVRGPASPGYNEREIGNSRIVRQLVELGAMEGPLEITVIAHSSGAFVANEFFSQISARRNQGDVEAQIHYYNLDGAGLRVNVEELASYCPVFATDGSRRSQNAGVAEAEGARAEAAGLGAAISVDASDSGCVSRWCLHDALINTRPHNPGGLSVPLDYTDFSEGRVETSYLEQGCLGP